MDTEDPDGGGLIPPTRGAVDSTVGSMNDREPDPEDEDTDLDVEWDGDVFIGVDADPEVGGTGRWLLLLFVVESLSAKT